MSGVNFFFMLNTLCIILPHNLRQFPFLSPPPQPTQCTTTKRICRSLGSDRHVEVYDCVAPPQALNDANTKMTTYSAAANISANNCASRDTSKLLLQGCHRHCYRPLLRNPEMCKGEIDPSAWTEEFPAIFHLHLLLRCRLRLRHRNCYLPLLGLRTKMTGTQRNTDT